MNSSVAMSSIYDEELPQEFSAGPSCSRNSNDEDDDWVIVKKQRITVLIPPPSPTSAGPESDLLKMNSKLPNLTMNKRNWDTARKKNSNEPTTMKCLDTPLEGIEVDDCSEKAKANHSVSVVHGDILRKKGGILRRCPAAPVAKSECNTSGGHAVQGLFHQGSEKGAQSSESMSKPVVPIVSSNVANKIMRARLLERQVAGFGGLRNWLFDCGLGWFIDKLDSEQLGMYQLVSLTMNQLKEMGFVAVGPRRKLIHAIDSLCCTDQLEMVS